MGTLNYEVRDRIAWIVMNRPEKLNAIDTELREEIFQAFEEVNKNPDIWIAVMTGTGRAFSVGHDLVQMGSGVKSAQGRTTDDLYIYQQSIYKPLIAAINGLCLAQGAGMALNCDIRIGSEKAQFGWPQVKRGISSISGPCLLSHMVPLNVAFEYLFTGEFIAAEDALRLHLLTRIVPHEQLLEKAEEIARVILQNAPLSVRTIKQATLQGYRLPLESRVGLARELSNALAKSEDAQEGLAAFKEKRAPVWKGR
ncbi:MAG: enoyl-CoA hydratase/isomerase family protein [Chloroflexi bacterium]|nr:enoyl-CoA hydratase/isomerase family protein [Chloroflexota bacterium]